MEVTALLIEHQTDGSHLEDLRLIVAIADLIMSQREQLALIASNWLACGATSFSVWETEGALISWPSNTGLNPATLSASLQLGTRIIGELRLTGLHSSAAQTQLSGEARLLAQVLQLEDELQQMTGDLIETQDQLLAMYDLTQATRDNLGVNETLRRLARESARLLKTEGAVFVLVPTMVQYPADATHQQLLLEYIQRAQESGRELVLSASETLLPADVTNICVLPFRVRNVSASLALINRAGGFTAPDLKLARAIAEQAAAQLEHTLLYQETLALAKQQVEMEIARKVQLQLLPQERPSAADLDIFAESRPALRVGGDFYDFVADPGRSLILLLGDVVGKGMSAALIMGMIHAVTRSAMRFMPLSTPASILRRTNHDLYDELTMLGSFATMFVAQYESGGKLLRYANAGHAPVLYRPPGGPARLIEGDGVPVGVLPNSISENYTLPFGPSALLVVTTDGFNEARNPGGEMYGIDRLLQLIDEFADQPAQVIATALFDAVDAFAAGQPQDDDQTLIVVKGLAV